MNELESTIDEIRACLQAEQHAIVKLDGGGLEDLAMRKEGLAHQLGQLLAASNRDERRALRDPLLELQRAAEVNRLLLADALDALASFMGPTEGSGTYDGKAVVQRATGRHIDVGA